MMQWNNAIYDRTEDDVERAQELAKKGYSEMTEAELSEWIVGLKGAFNQSDIERIENNVQLLSDRLDLNLVTNYGENVKYPDEHYFEQLLLNVEKIRAAHCIHADTPETPVEPVNDFNKVNDVEKILNDVYTILISNFHYYAGESYYAGDNFGLLL